MVQSGPPGPGSSREIAPEVTRIEGPWVDARTSRVYVTGLTATVSQYSANLTKIDIRASMDRIKGPFYAVTSSSNPVQTNDTADSAAQLTLLRTPR